MRLAIVNLTGGGLSGGYRKYLHTFVPRLRKDSRLSDILVAVPPLAQGSLKEVIPECIAWAEGDQHRKFCELRSTVINWKPDVVFIPNSAWQQFGATPVVTMVRNMEMATMPIGGNSVVDAAKNILRRWRAKKACRRSDRTIAISNFVKEYLIEEWHIPQEKVGLVYFGVEEPTIADRAMLKQHNLIEKEFILAAGSVRPYRGLEDVISACALLPSIYDKIKLVIVGSPDRGSEWYELRMRNLANRLGVTSRIIWTGSLPPNDLGQLMGAARSFVMTSRVEACPNVALEAMAARARIISTNNKPMPEFFENAANYYRAGNAVELARCITDVLSEPADVDLRNRERSSEIAKKFTWAETARRTIDELEIAVSCPTRHL